MSTVAPREVTDISEKERQAIIEDLTSDAGQEAAKPKDSAVETTKDSHREYVVLRGQENDNDGVGWIYVKNVEATSSEQAIRKTAEDLESQHPVTFVAIPVRSFVPATVSVKTTKTLILT